MTKGVIKTIELHKGKWYIRCVDVFTDQYHPMSVYGRYTPTIEHGAAVFGWFLSVEDALVWYVNRFMK